MIPCVAVAPEARDPLVHLVRPRERGIRPGERPIRPAKRLLRPRPGALRRLSDLANRRLQALNPEPHALDPLANTLVDLNLNYKLNQNLSLFCDVINLFDAQIKWTRGYSHRGNLCEYLGARVSLGVSGRSCPPLRRKRGRPRTGRVRSRDLAIPLCIPFRRARVE
jgi:hypothetical protein